MRRYSRRYKLTTLSAETEYCGIFAQSKNCRARETAVASERL
jgi:hypothetical protein